LGHRIGATLPVGTFEGAIYVSLESLTGRFLTASKFGDSLVSRRHEHFVCSSCDFVDRLLSLKAYKEFQGRASERTWLVGILKHKIVDHFRRANA